MDTGYGLRGHGELFFADRGVKRERPALQPVLEIDADLVLVGGIGHFRDKVEEQGPYRRLADVVGYPRQDNIRQRIFFLREGRVMYYEEKWIDGWLWRRREVDGQWLKASDEQMITRMRKALEFVVAGTDGYEHKQTDLAWLRSSLMAARGAALAALGR